MDFPETVPDSERRHCNARFSHSSNIFGLYLLKRVAAAGNKHESDRGRPTGGGRGANANRVTRLLRIALLLQPDHMQLV